MENIKERRKKKKKKISGLALDFFFSHKKEILPEV